MQAKYEQKFAGGPEMNDPPQKLYPQGFAAAPQVSGAVGAIVRGTTMDDMVGATVGDTVGVGVGLMVGGGLAVDRAAAGVVTAGVRAGLAVGAC